ncbi:hypothetical protein EW146_g5929 [Bondarzewia mesenterica]|uniref:Uncharacterized protein n=1 Tax=Bondarzewia mesenterica TaxID=1095465 RepID=A0A4S4LRV3_9AGAM|nr:hypothetical protein EW146_g5929 [Bondarzewia mesenterica]
MDDDITFGASVWATPNNNTTVLSSPIQDDHPSFSRISSSPVKDDGFDDFDSFGTPADFASTGGDVDDFGDFGDFGEAQEAESGFADDAGFDEQARWAGPSSREWEALRLDPLPSRAGLEGQINNILGPLWATDDLSQAFTDEDIREVGGLNQVLITPESRSLYQALFPPTPPSAQPPNWTRSRIRRQHLIALGVPVNIDEFLPQAKSKPMPALHITTRPMSAPPGPRQQPSNSGANSTSNSRNNSRVGTPVQPPSRGAPSVASQLGLGPKPQLDEQTISDLLELTEDNLSLLPLHHLEAHLTSLQAQTSKTSALLTYLLQTRDALQQDSETYNKLIGELVGEAQKMKTGIGKGRTAMRRDSGIPEDLHSSDVLLTVMVNEGVI